MGKEYIKSVYCHSAYVRYTEYIMKNDVLNKSQLESRLPGEISTTSDVQMIITLIAESEEELKSLLKVKEENEKIDLKLNIQKPKIMASIHITSWQIDGEKVETVIHFIFLG